MEATKIFKRSSYNSESFKAGLIKLKLKSFEPKIQLSFKYKNFLIKTADTPEELNQVIRLRYEVFIKQGLGKFRIFNNDFDRLDLLGDHIVLIDTANNNKIIGTYRLICNSFSNQFYSESEFNISEFLKTPGIKLELGRACIHKDYRNGLAIGLIWQGLAKYISLTSTDLLFGCTSVDTIHPFVATALYENFKKDSVSYEFNISPKSKYKFGRIFKTIDDEPLKNYEKHIPTLLKSYLKAGAKIYSFPALDRDFKCIDFFTILKVSEMSEKYKNKFF